MKLTASTHKGQVRTVNQDTVRLGRADGGRLAYVVVCDGMGGMGGQTASEVAAEAIEDMLRRDLRAQALPRLARPVLTCALAAANSAVYEMALACPELKGMGSTVVALVTDGKAAYLSSVGDSRAYLLGDEGLVQLTRDHTVVQMLLEEGEITPQQAKVHPQRHYITRALGIEREVDGDYLEQPLPPRGVLLVCSDGLYNCLEPDEMEALLLQAARQGSAAGLVDAANRQGGQDNITAAVLWWQEEEGTADE